ncbi:GyrI-like domain-containing protein [Anaerolentibacter hominis]|uniref:GyrI-like domain-containing protein n=1 Tax=Anaerolentibacter hominis TaxID=3079009 RepID=UPI0031B80932
MQTFDYKKEYKDLYLPGKDPVLIQVPPMHFAAVEGEGNPNDPHGEYKTALELLYAISYTLKMSYKSGQQIEGYYPYVVPPLEGLWRMADGSPGVDYANKSGFCWISMIRLPEFVTPEVFDWAKEEAMRKKKLDTKKAYLFPLEEGLCVQCMHLGSYDEEPATTARMNQFLTDQGYREDFTGQRMHHEIYLSDPRRAAPERLKTVIRHPVAAIK